MDARAARTLVLIVIGLGIVADVLFDRARLGLNVPIAAGAILVILTLIGRRHGRPDRADLWLPVVAMVAAALVAVRTDGPVVLLDCGLAAVAIGAWAWAARGVPVTRQAATVVVALGVWAAWSLSAGGLMLMGRATADASAGRILDRLGRAAPVVRGLLVAVPVLVVFAGLLASADAVFARLVSDVLAVPIDPTEPLRRTAIVAVMAWIAAGPIAIASGLLALPSAPSIPGAAPDSSGGGVDAAAASGEIGASGASGTTAGGPRPRAATETVVVLAAVDVLFAVFVVLQVAYLFGGADTLAATGMPYSAYARQGYFQLVAVVVLAGGLLMLGTVIAGRSRSLVVASLALLGLTALILVSAAVRLSLYLQAYGWTELRFYVVASIAWLAVAGVLATVLLLRDRMAWLLHGLAIAGVAITLAVSAIGPQAFITDQNVARVLDPRLVPPDGEPGLDLPYLVSLDDDAVPALVAALDRLAPADRTAVLDALLARRDALAADRASMGWASWNLARERARNLLAGLPDR